MAGPTATATEIKAGALGVLGALAAGESATSADDTLAGNALDRLIDRMARVGDVGFDKANIPDYAKAGMIDMLAADLAPHFSKPLEERDRLIGMARAARHEFRRIAVAKASRARVSFTDF